MHESLKIVQQCADQLAKMEGEPVMVADKKRRAIELEH